MTTYDQDQYEIVIIQCCENCETHQSYARHSEWKYFQQFNQLKRKIQRFVNNAIVIKNPIPDELVKDPELRMNKNAYLNKEKNQQVIFPRIGAFQIYIYNILIYSKLITNTWPNHYKIIEIINKMIEEKKKGNNLEQFSVYRQMKPQLQQKNQKQKKGTSKKKKNYRVYKSKQHRSILDSTPPKKQANLQISSQKKNNRRTLIDQEDTGARNLESKGGNRVKLPALKKTIDFSKEEVEQENVQKKDSLKKIFNSIQQLEKDDMSFIHKKGELSKDQFGSMEFINDSIQMKDMDHKSSMKFLEDRSVQYSEREQGRDFMNRSIQYTEDEGFHCDFGLQIDDGSHPKEIGFQFVQTQKIQIKQEQEKQKKFPYMLDEIVEANIEIRKDQTEQETQTHIIKQEQAHTNTDLVSLINRGYQFPEEEVQQVKINQFSNIDENFIHLYDKRRNMINNNYYSIDKFEEKATKYKWTGRASLNANIDDLRKKLLVQCLVFCVYNQYGIKTPEKRLSFQKCSNIIAEEKNIKNSDVSLVHVLSSENPQLQFPFVFEEFSPEQKKFPLSQELTFKNSKQKIKFNGYGGLLAIAYFLNDYQLFNSQNTHIGIVISNQQVKQIYKLNADEYQISPESRPQKRRIIINQNGLHEVGDSIVLDRLSETVEYEFIGMLNRLVSNQGFEELIKTIQQVFINMTPSYKTFRNSLLSLKTQNIDQEIVQEFIVMLEYRKKYLQQQYKGQLYAFQTYKSLQPKIKFSLQNINKKDAKRQELKIDRRFKYSSKIVRNNQIIKHIRSKDHFVIISGQSGLGKTSFLNQVRQNLQANYSDKVKVWNITTDILTDEQLLKKTVDKIMDESHKQIIIIDDGEHYFMQIVQLVGKLYNKDDPRSRPQLSFCLATSGQTHRFQNRFLPLGIKTIECTMLPVEIEEIRNYLMKSIQFHNYSDKKNFTDEILGIETTVFNEAHPKYNYISFLQNPFYLNIYAYYLSHQEDLDDFKSCLLYSLNKYTLLKEVYGICWRRHHKQIKSMHIPIIEPLHDLRKMAFEYFHNNRQVNECIREIMDRYQTDQIVSNQLCFYPIDIEAGIKKQKPLFLHNEYFNFFLVEAYCYYTENGYKYMRMNKLYNDKQLLALTKQHYIVERTHSKLLDVVYQTRKFKNTSEQGSNAITLLAKIDHLFTNTNLDDVEVPQADLSSAIFYNCSFRGTNLLNATLYKSQFINCAVDTTKLDNMNIFQKKIQSQYTVLAAALSNDGKNLALGCGNYLIILNTESGKELKKIQAHMDIIRTVKYSRDGTSLVTIADDKTLRIWDIRSYRSVVFRLPQKGTIAFSNQTETIASVTKSYLKVWNIKSMANEFVFEGHSDLITSVSFSLDGNLIITGSRDTTLRLWSIKKGQQIHTYRSHSTEVINAKISPTKRLILSSSKDNDLILWDLASRTELVKKNYGDEVVEFCMDEKEKYAVISFSKESFIFVVQLSNLQTVHTLYGHRARVISINFDLYYRKLVSLSKDKTVKIWQLDKIMEQENRVKAKENKKFNIAKGTITALAYCKFSRRYATAHENGQINIFSAEDNRQAEQLQNHNGMLHCLTFDRSGKLYAGGSDGTLRIWNLGVKKQPRTVEIHSSEMIQLKLNERNRLIATSSTANELVVYDFTGIKLIMSTREEGRVHSIEFSKDEKIMAAGGVEKYVAIYEILDGGNTVRRMEELGPNPDVINCMTFHSDSLLVVALRNGHIMIWNHIKSSLTKKIENVSTIHAMLSFQKRYVCFSSDDGKIRIIDMEEGRQVKVFRYSEISFAITTNPNEDLIYSGTKEGNLLIWNANSIHPTPEKVKFDRVAIDKEGEKTVHVEGSKDILLRSLNYHEEQHLKLNELESEIDGVAFHQNKVILLLKNGMHWDVNRRKQYHFGVADDIEGDLYYVRDRTATNFFKTPVRKLKGIRRPVLNVLEELLG